MIPVTWHVITIADGERFAVVVGETTIASFATPEEADNVCIQLAMAYYATPLTISYAPVARGSSAERSP